MNTTGISWTDLTWNPVTGCDKVSPGCQNCYAEKRATNPFYRKAFPNGFKVTLHPDRLKQVSKIPSGSKVFVNSMSDLFHEDVPFSFIKQVLDAIRSRPDVVFQILTKRPARAARYWHYTITDRERGFPENIWLGVSVEMRYLTQRILTLRYDVPAPLKFISFEPLIRDIRDVDLTGIDWIIIGGESGPNHRPMKLEWARNLIRQAKEQNVAVWMKQLGGSRPGTEMSELPEDMRIREFPEVKA